MDLQPYVEPVALLIVFIQQVIHHKKLNTIKNNDLHEMPLVVPTLNNVAETLQRIEVKLGEEFSYIRARLNGGPK